MNYNIILTEKAISDIDEIAAYIFQASKSLTVTQDFIMQLYDKMEILKTFPNTGCFPRNHSLLTQGYRFLVHEQYLIFYRIEKTTVYVSAVFNSKKDYLKFYIF